MSVGDPPRYAEDAMIAHESQLASRIESPVAIFLKPQYWMPLDSVRRRTCPTHPWAALIKHLRHREAGPDQSRSSCYLLGTEPVVCGCWLCCCLAALFAW